ncbi:hypothetical protein BD779DRAFT_1668504 [Infundibulicybe gibba]|nr:hypothetical protein BD779DRAFT_1668504 [Infundibulicybe gibba]
MFKLAHIFSALVLLLGATQALAAPNPQESGPSLIPSLLHCADGVHTCLPGWTCCGPITTTGGT